METNIIGMVIRFLTIFPGFIICALLFCISIILLIIKRETLKIYKKIIFIMVAVISFGFVCLAIRFGVINSVETIGISDEVTIRYLHESNKNIEIGLFYNDYEIVSYSEHSLLNNQNTIQMNLKLRITNFEKLNLLINSIEPIIKLNFNNKIYIARGQLNILSTFPKECDYMFPLNGDGKIEFFEDKIINFLGFENR